MRQVGLVTALSAALCVGAIPAMAQNPILFSGGISLDERELAPATGTKLVFFVRSGAFVANVQVRIINQQGTEVVNTMVDGPWLIVDLPNGQYRVEAEVQGRGNTSATIEIGGSQREFGFAFPD